MKSFIIGLSFIFTISFVTNSQTVKIKYSEGYISTKDSVNIFYRILGEGKDTILMFHGGGFGSSYLVPDLTPLVLPDYLTLPKN